MQIDKKNAILYLSKMGGGHRQQRILAHQQVNLDLTSQQTDCTACRVPYQFSECTCRLRVTKRQGQVIMETKRFSFSREMQHTLDN